MIHVYDPLLLKNIMFPLLIGLYDGTHFLIISRITLDNIKECFNVTCPQMSLLNEDCTNAPLFKRICLNVKWLLEV